MFDDIKIDLFSLWENNKVLRVEDLNTSLRKNYFHPNQEPMYFVGNISSPTVLVMLNPGNGNTSNRPYSFWGDKYNLKTFENYYDSHISSCKNYGSNDKDRLDNFDAKQAAFLHDFQDLGFEIPEKFWDEDVDNEKKKHAKQVVLTNKLQLELIPYCSVSFNSLIDNAKNANEHYALFEPHLIRILNTINEHNRTHILFCSKQFYYLLEAASKTALFYGKIKFTPTVESKLEKLTLRFNKVSINYGGKQIKAGIVHSFASQALPNAYEKMAAYGKFCYENLQEENILNKKNKI
jgi:hypothetical protein